MVEFKNKLSTLIINSLNFYRKNTHGPFILSVIYVKPKKDTRSYNEHSILFFSYQNVMCC